ncbi:MAG: alkyl hydroperoxide reductase [Gallionellaceae bacterium CG1_02_56_997]|nr:MAG: alkyl hydroperoxide reductase [Gallionellaceae bacterium CG1_02_56_997]PIR10476.1 MAG: alkyl hydroperoxide reductase [Gallionellaceae bacterium CG11_big_fil_rev_8_21_14_0_20_60_62]PIY06656.1 MAG: alkyl hydroperoxide reductase [Gallionellaceae bacterium CG_4_10_14_3_um_filter_60_1069]
MSATHALAPAWQVGQWFNCRQPLKLERMRGRIVVLHAFQMLCPGCVSHGVPLAERVHRQLAGDDLVVVGLHTVFEHHAAMTPVALEAFLHEYQITHPVGVDAHAPGVAIPLTMASYGLRGTPSMVVIDHLGRIRMHEFGKVDELLLGSMLGKLQAEAAAGRENHSA